MVELSWMSRRSIPTLGLLTSRVLVQKRCWVSRWTSVYATWRLDTCRHSANPCPVFLVVVTYARLVVVNWTFHVSIWLCMGDRRLPMPVPHLGTLYLTVSRTLILLCKPSNAILRPSCFPHTSTFSVFDVSYKNVLYKSTVIIIIEVYLQPMKLLYDWHWQQCQF